MVLLGPVLLGPVLLGVVSAFLAGSAAWKAAVADRLGPALEQICRDLFCDPDQASREADRLADADPAAAPAPGEPEALRLSRLALANDPASPFRWCDLGDLYLALYPPGYLEQARACFRRAAELGSHSPIILQRIANYDFQVGDNADALRRGYGVLQRVRDFDGIIFSSYLRFGITQADVMAHGIPPEPEPVRSYLRFVFSRDDPRQATVAWRWASGLTPSPVSDPLAQSYIALLWRHAEFAGAVQSWAAYLGPRAGDYPGPNRIFNGGFESEPSNGTPLDWRRDEVAGADIRRDYEVHQQGQFSMRVAFSGTQNLDFHGLSQTQPVSPGRYRLRASIKTQGLTTDQGVRLRVLDPEASRLDAGSPAITGSSDWHTVELRFEVRSPTRLVRVELARNPSLKFDNQIAGTLWIDAVSLTPAN